VDLYRYDESFRGEGFRRVAGIDEAGRGPVAGPVVAAAVVLGGHVRLKGLRDSKKVPERERLHLFNEILYSASDIGIGISEVDVIDRVNILEATRLAMGAAVLDLLERPDLLLIDAVSLPSVGIKQVCPYKGESKSAAIAAASIVAKVTRDSIMLHYHSLYPEYGFDRHKGYFTRDHMRSIMAHGPCPLHRKSFRGVMTLALPF
jgi:ribonuclease HII